MFFPSKHYYKYRQYWEYEAGQYEANVYTSVLSLSAGLFHLKWFHNSPEHSYGVPQPPEKELYHNVVENCSYRKQSTCMQHHINLITYTDKTIIIIPTVHTPIVNTHHGTHTWIHTHAHTHTHIHTHTHTLWLS